MYRSAARRLLPALCRRPARFSNQASPARFSAPIVHQAAFSAGAASENAPNYKPGNFDSSNSSSTSSSSEGRNPRVTATPKAHWQEEQARVLQASLRHVVSSLHQILQFSLYFVLAYCVIALNASEFLHFCVFVNSECLTFAILYVLMVIIGTVDLELSNPIG